MENIPIIRILASSGTADFRIVIPSSRDSET